LHQRVSLCKPCATQCADCSVDICRCDPDKYGRPLVVTTGRRANPSLNDSVAVVEEGFIWGMELLAKMCRPPTNHFVHIMDLQDWSPIRNFSRKYTQATAKISQSYYPDYMGVCCVYKPKQPHHAVRLRFSYRLHHPSYNHHRTVGDYHHQLSLGCVGSLQSCRAVDGPAYHGEGALFEEG
jgi:hypothetical protein